MVVTDALYLENTPDHLWRRKMYAVSGHQWMHGSLGSGKKGAKESSSLVACIPKKYACV